MAAGDQGLFTSWAFRATATRVLVASPDSAGNGVLYSSLWTSWFFELGIGGGADATEAGADTVSAVGAVAVSGRGSATESGADTASASGTVAFAGVSGSGAATEVG